MSVSIDYSFYVVHRNADCTKIKNDLINVFYTFIL